MKKVMVLVVLTLSITGSCFAQCGSPGNEAPADLNAKVIDASFQGDLKVGEVSSTFGKPLIVGEVASGFGYTGWS